MRTTIRNVAQEAGVSTATVSLVLRGIDGRTTPETRERVLRVAQRLDYLPVKPPTSQNRPLETRIVTLVPEHQDMENHDLHMLTYRGVVSVARQYGYDVLTAVGQESQHYTSQDKNRYLNRHSDGFIFAVSYQGIWENALRLLSEYEIPAVACFRPTAPPRIAAVSVDNAAAIRLVTEHLVERGHRKIAYLCGPPDNFDEKVRREAWIQVMQEHDLDASERFLVPGSGSRHALDTQAIGSVGRLGVTAVVCYNDAEALLLWDLLESQGLKVPNDISLTGIDDNPYAGARNLTTIAHSFIDIGRLAMEAWIELKNGGEAHDCYKLAPVKLVSRASVRDLSV